MNEKTTDVLAGLINDPTVMEIMVDRYDRICVERKGKLEDVESPFHDNDNLLLYIQRLAANAGLKLVPGQPMIDIIFPNNEARATAVIPPVAVDGAKLVIRKFPNASLTLEEVINRYQSLNEVMAKFLKVCVQNRLNILVAGSAGSGKTTILNIIAQMIDPEERVILLSEGAELKLEGRRVINLQTYSAGGEVEPVTLNDLVLQAAKMRPDRIVLSELRGEETLNFLSSINTGYDGCLTSLHATGVRDALARIELLVAGVAPTMPLLATRELIADTLNVIVSQQRLRDGSRRMLAISEVTGIVGGNIQTEDIFVFKESGQDEKGQLLGQYQWTGYLPKFARSSARAKLNLTEDFFKE